MSVAVRAPSRGAAQGPEVGVEQCGVPDHQLSWPGTHKHGTPVSGWRRQLMSRLEGLDHVDRPRRMPGQRGKRERGGEGRVSRGRQEAGGEERRDANQGDQEEKGDKRAVERGGGRVGALMAAQNRVTAAARKYASDRTGDGRGTRREGEEEISAEEEGLRRGRRWEGGKEQKGVRLGGERRRVMGGGGWAPGLGPARPPRCRRTAPATRRRPGRQRAAWRPAPEGRRRAFRGESGF